MHNRQMLGYELFPAPDSLPDSIQPDLTVQFDLSQDQMTALLEQCRKEGRPVQEICRSAIAHYLSQPAPETIDQMLARVSIE